MFTPKTMKSLLFAAIVVAGAATLIWAGRTFGVQP
jgi:hypothetical protein